MGAKVPRRGRVPWSRAERFGRGFRVAASLQQANVVPLLTAGDADGLAYFTRPYVEGQSLRVRLASGPSLTVAECLSILRDVTRALAGRGAGASGSEGRDGRSSAGGASCASASGARAAPD